MADTQRMNSNVGPLTGVRVVDGSSFVSGPYAGQMLADLGAEVIKIEPPRGDPFRRFGRPTTPISGLFASCNHGKRSVSLDLKAPDGRAALLELLAVSDVWLSNWRPDVAGRLQIDDDVLAAANDQLIRVYITGYGPTGPMALAPAYDTIVQAHSGLTDALATDGTPVISPGYPIDKLTATMATQAVLAALFARERNHTGGDRIDLSMLDTASYNSFADLFVNRSFVDRQPVSARNPHATALRPLRAADGWVVVAPVSGVNIKSTCEVAGHPEWVPEILGQTDETGVSHALFARLEQVFPGHPAQHWLDLLAAHDVPAARCLTMDEHLSDPQVLHGGTYQVEEWDDIGRVRTVGYPAVFGRYGRPRASGPAPRIGADTVADLLAPERPVAPEAARVAGPA
jgi:CoA:oxalate CoA-transferase